MRSTLTALVAATLLAACGDDPFNQDPQVSDVSLNAATMAETQRVSVPMPPPQQQPMALRAERASLWQQGSDGFFADQRARQVGDILTIIINIDDEASLSNISGRLRRGGASIGFPRLLGYQNKLDRLLPGVDEADISGEDLVDVEGSLSTLGTGTIDRNEEISLKIAALVVQMLPNGNMVLAGRQEVKVNRELRELRVAGIIRPEDVQMDNTIPYEKMAEARITYGGEGQISRQQRQSYGEGVMDIILPF